MNTVLRKYGTLCLIATMFVACKDANSQQQKEVVDTQEHKSVSSEPQDPINPGVIAEMPEFPGGMEKLIQFIEENTHLPKCVTDGKVQGRSVIEMVVEKDGTLSDFKVVRSLHKDCDSEAIRVLKSMPRWKPARLRGKTVRMQYTVPVQFKPKQQKEVVDTQVHNCVPSEPQGPIEPEEEVFDKDYFEEMPEFPGGMEKLIQFIEENTHLPKCVTYASVEGRSVIEMVVEKDGTLSDFKVVRSLHKDCDAEAIRVLKTMPKWKPGKVCGKPIRVKYTVPVQFRKPVSQK